MKRALAGAGVAVLLVALAGCTDDPSDPRGTAVPAATAPAAAAPVDVSCRPRQSLRPTGTLPRPGRMPAGTYLAQIQKRGRLVLGTSQDTLLFSSRNPRTGAVEGFDVDLGRQLAEAIFGDPDRLQIKVIGYDQRVPLAAAGIDPRRPQNRGGHRRRHHDDEL